MSAPSFSKGSLIVTCHGAPCLQNGAVLMDGVVPSHAMTSFFLNGQQFVIILPERHNAVAMIKSSHSFCVNVLPSTMIHDSLMPQQGEEHFVEHFQATGLEAVPCEHIKAQRFVQAAVSMECLVSHYVLLEGFVLIKGAVVTAHYHDKHLAKAKHVLEGQSVEQEA